MCLKRASSPLRGEKSGSNPVFGRFGVGFRTPFCAHPAHAWRMMPLLGHFWSKCRSSGGLGGENNPQGTARVKADMRKLPVFEARLVSRDPAKRYIQCIHRKAATATGFTHDWDDADSFRLKEMSSAAQTLVGSTGNPMHIATWA